MNASSVFGYVLSVSTFCCNFFGVLLLGHSSLPPPVPMLPHRDLHDLKLGFAETTGGAHSHSQPIFQVEQGKHFISGVTNIRESFRYFG